LTWYCDNFTVWFHSFGIKKTKVYYHDFITNPISVISTIMDIKDNEKELLKNRGPLLARHLVAGSRFRMDNELFIKKNDFE
jgi:LPS sulfotransferase NodH